MNERIKQLAEQATEYNEQVTEYTERIVFRQLNPEKFAELILKECLKYIDDSFGDIDYVKFMIKRNFGVEE